MRRQIEKEPSFTGWSDSRNMRSRSTAWISCQPETNEKTLGHKSVQQQSASTICVTADRIPEAVIPA